MTAHAQNPRRSAIERMWREDKAHALRQCSYVFRQFYRMPERNGIVEQAHYMRIFRDFTQALRHLGDLIGAQALTHQSALTAGLFLGFHRHGAGCICRVSL